jgi:hypothetical protein
MDRINFSRLICLIVSIGLISLTACTMRGNMVFHSFEFDTRHDSPDVDVLDYHYGSSRQIGTHPEKERVLLGEKFAHNSISGVMPRGEFLYVKWRIRGTGKIYEDKVDLKTRVPADIANHTIYFAVRGAQLYVYLISPELHPPFEPDGPIRVYKPYKQHQIYPDQSK